MTSIGAKVAYVLDEARISRESMDHSHRCHWPECPEIVPPSLWGCKKHWYMLPKFLRDAIWRAYRIRQEKDKNPSTEYLKVARSVQKWIIDHHPPAATQQRLF